MEETGITLTYLEVFFVATTVVSLVVNLLQWRDRRAFQGPLTNALVALFNDIKAKTSSAQFVYGALFNPINPHKEIDTLRWEYGLFVQELTGYFQGFQESVVAILVTLNPEDKEGESAFRASDYGLTEQEKEWKERRLEQLREQTPQPILEANEATAQEDGDADVNGNSGA
jgi:hypothetical protein